MCSLSLRCFAGSLAVEQDCSTRRKATCTHPQKCTNTHTRTHRMSVGGSPLTSARGLAPQMIKASGDTEKQACVRRQMRKTNIQVSVLTCRHEEEICTAVMLPYTKANKQLLISFQGEKKPIQKQKILKKRQTVTVARHVQGKTMGGLPINCKKNKTEFNFRQQINILSQNLKLICRLRPPTCSLPPSLPRPH